MSKLIIFTNRDLASNVNLNVLLPRIHRYVIQIFISDKVGKAIELPKPLQMLKFFEQTLPNTILFPELDKQNRNLNNGKFLTFNELSRKYNIPLDSLNDVKSEESLNKIQTLKPDLALSVRYGKIFGKAALQIPKYGFINFHSGLLPNYRGVLAGFRALHKGDSEIIGTLHTIDDGTIDTGQIIGFSHVPASLNQSFLHQILSLYPASTELIANTIESLLKGETLSTFPQTTEGAAYYTFPSEEEVANFESKGGTFVDTAEFEAWIRRYL